ncbi:MAG: PAS domain S-box protein [Anaerolineae bacterium]|nr:PAS domain S-box protein [Anaerolineae bacterium]
MSDYNKSKSELIEELVQLRQELAQLKAEQNAIEQESVQQKELLDIIIDALPLGIFVKDVQNDYRFIIWNTQMETFFETERVNILGNSDYDLFGKEKADYFRSTDVNVMGSRELFDIPTEEVPTSQGVILAHTTKVPIYDDDGQPQYLLGLLEDITERKKTEEERQHLMTAVEQSANTIVITDLKGNIEYANPSFERTTGYTLDEAQGKHTRILKSGYTNSEEYTELWETITSGKIWQGEFYNKRKNGEYYWESASISPIRNTQGEITHFLAVKEDITERKKSEEMLIKRASELAMVTQVATASSSLLDAEAMLQTVLALTKERFDLYHAHAYVLNESGTVLKLIAGAGEKGAELVSQGWSIPLNHSTSLVARVARSQQSVIVCDVDKGEYLANPLLPEIRSQLAVPMIVGKQLLGVLDFQSDKTDHFSDEDANIKTILASQVAVALQNAKQFEYSRRQAEREQLVNTITQKIQNTVTVDRALQVAVQELGQAFRARSTLVRLKQGDKKTFAETPLKAND